MPRAAKPSPAMPLLAALGLALLLLAPSLAPLAAAQANATAGNATSPNATAPSASPPAPTTPGAADVSPYEALPAEWRAEAQGWLDADNARVAAFRALHPGNSTVADIFLEGADDFLRNESSVGLTLSQLLQVEHQLWFDQVFPPVPEDQRRSEFYNLSLRETNVTRAQLATFWQRLGSVEGGLKTTQGLEYALEAARLGVVADVLVSKSDNTTDQLLRAPVAEQRIVRSTLFYAHAPQSFVAWANQTLDLALRLDAEGARPRLPDGALDRGIAKVRERLSLDPDARSTTGPQSTEAAELLARANTTGPRLLYLARFLFFEETRSDDALEFRKSHATLGLPQLVGNLGLALENATFIARYDGGLDRTQEAAPLAKARSAGFQGLLQIEARNHARYRLQYDNAGTTAFTGLSAAWAEMVSSTYAASTEQAIGPGAPGQGDTNLLLYGGVAVAAALAVAAIALLRR